MARYMVLASFDRKLGPIGYGFKGHCDLKDEPSGTTLGFRQVYRRCFSAVDYDILKKPVPIDWLGQPFKLHEIYHFESIGTALSETEGDSFLVGFVVSLDQPPAASFNRIRALTGLDEQGAIYTLLAALPEKMRETFTDRLTHTMAFPGLSTFALPDGEGAATKAMMLFSFFYIGKLLLWRIRRDQADINISLLQKNFKEAIFLTAIQRSRIINIKRYQLTSNVTNNPDLGALANALKTRLNIEAEYQNDEELNKLIEEYLASLEKLFSEESRRRIERGLAVFSFIAVPFTVFAAFVALIGLRDDLEIFRSTLTWSSTWGFWFLLGLSTAIPITLYAASFVVERSEKVDRRLKRFREKNHPSKSSEPKHPRPAGPSETRSR